MTSARWLDPEERQAWLALLAVTTLLPGKLDAVLQQAKVTLFDYNVLAMLSEAEDRTLPMSELASRTYSSLSRLSHVVKKLEQRGWVSRSQCADDARVTMATLSDQGFKTIDELAPAHVESVRQVIFDGLDRRDVADLERIGKKVVELLEPTSWVLREPRLNS
ncbi:MarR family transcriptional regulator [Arthrobacter crystallopoietes BAB-32]|uniref:MarR family transcriptional regulator n=1 Tax=Arthrobacter crystallopoietes BAB-32 TaxID=1246476 RepID=N1V7V8_9MICC|nr:MarR family transcriptional regulator [Arthrobacter crystallopoietes]EMY36094.1 MarR family transcriptional regulator [Arthrobacter crystallopoietes BAB-32]